MRKRISVVLLALSTAVAAAHPMGNFSVSHYTNFVLTQQGVEITYVLDLAEVPAYTLLRDWKLTASSAKSELDLKAAEQAKTWAQGLEFRSGGKIGLPVMRSASIQVRNGSDGQPTARLTSVFSLTAASPLEFEDHNYADRNGWKEIVIGDSGSNRSHGLTQYPADALSSAPQEVRARIEWNAGVGNVDARLIPVEQPPAVPPPAASTSTAATRTPTRNDFLSRLLARQEIGWGWLFLGLVVAFGLGGAHALEPGHGKTLVAAYLVGSRGTMKHAALLGAMVTFTHTISVFLLGLAMLALSKSVVPDRVIRILEAVSGLSIVIIGAVMLVHRLRSLRTHAAPHHHHHDHSHAHDHHVHDHSHPHTHDHHHHHAHDHGPHGHSHLPEGEITAGSLIALGVTGGLVPCPAALVIMLAAIAFGHVGAGLILLIAFSLGLAAVLMGIGMMVLYAKSWLPDLSASSRHPFLRLVPVLSAIVVMCLGLLMTGVSLGWLRAGFSV